MGVFKIVVKALQTCTFTLFQIIEDTIKLWVKRSVGPRMIQLSNAATTPRCLATWALTAISFNFRFDHCIHDVYTAKAESTLPQIHMADKWQMTSNQI